MTRPVLVALLALSFVHPSDLGAAVVRPDGATLVYDPPGTDSAQNPAFSPDGRTLLFTVFHAGYNGDDLLRGDDVLRDRDGSNTLRGGAGSDTCIAGPSAVITTCEL